MPRPVPLVLLSLWLPRLLIGQFNPALLENRSYWGDGKSEIDFYQAEVMRDGEMRQCEVLVVLTPVFVEPNTTAYVESGKQSGVPAIRMDDTATIPRGLVVELRSIEALWRLDSMSLARLSFTGHDVFGNIAKTLRENRAADRITWNYSCDSYAGKIDSQPVAIAAKPTVAYDEMPLRVRTVDFSKSAGEFEVDIAATLTSSTKEFGKLKPAKISWKTGERTIDVDVTHPAGKDSFALDAGFPFLLREWRAWDGTHWKMKNSIKADYRKYLRNGDRERALKDPMLRHPD